MLFFYALMIAYGKNNGQVLTDLYSRFQSCRNETARCILVDVWSLCWWCILSVLENSMASVIVFYDHFRFQKNANAMWWEVEWGNAGMNRSREMSMMICSKRPSILRSTYGSLYSL